MLLYPLWSLFQEALCLGKIWRQSLTADTSMVENTLHTKSTRRGPLTTQIAVFAQTKWQVCGQMEVLYWASITGVCRLRYSTQTFTTHPKYTATCNGSTTPWEWLRLIAPRLALLNQPTHRSDYTVTCRKIAVPMWQRHLFWSISGPLSTS